MAQQIFNTPNYGKVTLHNAMEPDEFNGLTEIVEIRGEGIDININYYFDFSDYSSKQIEQLINTN